MMESNADIVAWIRILDRKEDVKPITVEWHLHQDVVRCELDAAFRSDFPADLRRDLHARAFPMFRRHYTRITFARHNALRSWTHLENLFYISANFFFDLIRRQGVTSAIFSNFPHEGTLIVAYHLCQLMGIRTVISTQSAFPAKLWIVRRIEDFGGFETVLGDGESLAPPSEPKTPFYMKNRGNRRRALGTVGRLAGEYVKLALKIVTLRFLFDRRAIDRNMTRLVQAKDRLRMGDPSGARVVATDLDRPFVYFPLHLQPEMTTDTWGFEYGDQVLAIEELAAALPPDMKIYLKENPIQTRYMREESFSRRIAAIQNVEYVASDTSTFDLIKKSRCVATITGTVGWEAVQIGKGVIHFGVTWYSSLPGAFRWQGAKTLDKALSFSGDRTSFEKCFVALSKKLYPGVIDPVYGAIVQGFDRNLEARRAAHSLLVALGEDVSVSDG